MLTRIAQLSTRHPRVILLAALALALVCVGFGASATSHLKSAGFTSDQAESTRAGQYLADRFDGAQPNFVLLVRSDQGVDSPDAKAAGADITQRLQSRSDVVGIRSYWTSPPNVKAALRSTDGKEGLIVAYLTGGDDVAQKSAGQIVDELDGHTPGVTVHAGGLAATYHEVNGQVTKDLAVAEGIAVPLTAIVLILVFGSVIAAALPLAVGLFAIASTMAILRLFTLFTDVSIYALNMTTALGLALAIDYSLFIVSRFREELAAGADHRAAAIRSVQTAGRTVLFSALTVALALAVLSVFNLYFLKSFAYAGVAVVATAAVASILVLPAALVLLGDRVNAWDMRVPLRRLLRRPAPAPRPLERTGWYRVVTWVMRRAVPVTLVITAVLLALGTPFLDAKFGYPDDRVLPVGADSRAVGDELRSQFPAVNAQLSTTVVLPGYRGDAGSYAAGLSKMNGVSAVLSNAGVYVSGARMAPTPPGMANDAGQFLTVQSKFPPFSDDSRHQLEQLREVPAPASTLFGGAEAMNADGMHDLGSRIPLAAILIALATFVVLFLFTGSVVLPLKTLVLNCLSLTAMFGMMVWIFQDGHLADLIGFTPTGYLVATMPMLMFCLAFGMSMDYEVFLLSRIREEWLTSDRTRAANTHSVAVGVARTGRIVTAAAVLMAIVLGAMAFGKVTFIQMFGLGLTLTVLADATVIRGLLVPALMRLLGTVNWWAPAPLARWHERFGLTEQSAPEPQPAGQR
ncbi:RND superfamily putative drug exporter [Nocardia pseudobrasiliensis]|uniref:RND superfamily putative drug exporter n=2 Tax=Nocardia pseudobrasiliensis TaxID=45979 RepID=A0A370I584_9NOCA|nr:MMPL family transporter [Nocardia pseudobrasiliensis]RDI65888.1 RND superfamily putative drug exporter [Nocardia pseudobrasiliensis]